MNIRFWLSLLRHVTITSFDKGEIIIPQGATHKTIFYIKKGLIRSYFENEKLEEITFHLFPESHVFANIHTLLFEEASQFSYQALEKTKVYAIDYDRYFQLMKKNPSMLELNRRHFSKRVLKQAFQRVESFVLLSPEERYQKYLKDYPSVIDRAPDKYIAHVLGMTPTSLSRIRKRISSKKA